MLGRAAILACVSLLAVTAAGCGGGGSGTETVVGIKSAEDSALLVDGSGNTLYTFSRGVDCSGQCATAWPPLLADGDVVPDDDSGLNEDLLGSTKRSDGKLQVTYDGEPLYTAGSGSTGAGRQFGGSWQVIRLPLDPLKREKSRGSCEPNCGY
jgi:predicted lipoprotein with Yx(FWY)xxD motif